MHLTTSHPCVSARSSVGQPRFVNILVVFHGVSLLFTLQRFSFEFINSGDPSCVIPEERANRLDLLSRGLWSLHRLNCFINITGSS